MSKCNVIFIDTDRPPVHVNCELDRGHDGAHRGTDTKTGCGAVWTDERRFKVHDNVRDDDYLEPA